MDPVQANQGDARLERSVGIQVRINECFDICEVAGIIHLVVYFFHTMQDDGVGILQPFDVIALIVGLYRLMMASEILTDQVLAACPEACTDNNSKSKGGRCLFMVRILSSVCGLRTP